tara:strand:+ start:646 stop:1524 length:879 start_codon:yes stop_codon:yes gene_type:complete
MQSSFKSILLSKVSIILYFTMPIIIYASELAIATRHNHYQNVTDYIVKLWRRYFPRDYENHMKLFQEKNDIEVVEETPEEYLRKLAKSSNVDISKCLNSKDVGTLNVEKKKIVETIISKTKNIDPKEILKLKECVERVTNTNFGTKHEVNSLKKYNSKTKKQIETTQKFFKKPFIKTSKFEWYLGGKIDGLDTEEDKIIEFKNRVNRLFYKLRDYEKVQTMTYMFLLDKKQSNLVENLKTKGENKMNVIEVGWDQKFWNDEVIEKTKVFINNFEKFIESTEQKLNLLEELCD